MRRVTRWGKVLSTGAAGIWLALVVAALSGCNSTLTGSSGNDPPDALDRIRLADLMPRFAEPPEDPKGERSAGARPAIQYGSLDQAMRGKPPIPVDAGDYAGGGYDLNFENVPVATVAKVVLGDILGVGYTIDPRVQGTITLASGRPVPKDDVLFVLENALRTSNAALVHDRKGSGYRLIPAAEAVGNGGIELASRRSLEPGYGVTVVPLQHVSVQTVTKLLEGFALKAGTLRADPSHNVVVVQGSAAERRAAVETVVSFDVDWMREQSVGIFPVRNTTPEPVIAELEKIIDSAEGGFSQNLIKVQAVVRLNAILVVTSKPALLRAAEVWINRLDNSQVANSGVKVYRVRNGDAAHLARLLNEMFVGGGAAGSLDSAASQVAPGSGLTTTSSEFGSASMSPADRLTGGGQTSLLSGQRSSADATRNIALTGIAPRAGAGGGNALLQGIRITADVTNNSLLIYANPASYQVIEKTLHQLDRPQLQVAIDATIAEVGLNDNLNYGVQTFLQSSDFGLKADVGSLINSAGGAVLAQTLPGFNFLVGSQATPRVILNALHGYTNVKILSNPSLVVVNNGVAVLQVGDQVPITTGTATVLSSNNAVVNTINYQNTGIILRVVPRINSNGMVSLEIEQEISEVSPTSATGTLTPTISQRKVKSRLSIANGQTVLLAGLISETQSRSRSGIPLLDQIPGIGDAFTQNQKQNMRTELIIFIRPQVIRDSVDASVVAEELRSKMKGGKIGSVNPPGAIEPLAPRVVR